MIDDLTIKKIKDAANVKDVIGDFYTLKRDGVNWTCLCPFHQDRHMGSFKVSEAKNMYTCYSCGAHGGPVDFLMQHEKMTFIEAIKWLGAKYGIEVEGSDEYREKVKRCQPHAPAPPLPTLIMPREWVRQKQQGVEENTLVRWIRSLNWSDEQRGRIDKMLRNYMIGQEKSGRTIFWQVDELGQVHTGKTMLYEADGHRNKEKWPNGKDKNPPNWIHTACFKANLFDPMEVEVRTCYFGQHLLKVCPTATVNIVESEKTALLCAIYFGDMRNNIWVACGGKRFFNKENLMPFIKEKRLINLYPDKDGFEEWKQKKQEIGYKFLRIDTTIVRKYWREEDGEKADIADILVRLMSTPTTLQSLVNENPALRTLIDTFDLIEIK